MSTVTQVQQTTTRQQQSSTVDSQVSLNTQKRAPEEPHALIALSDPFNHQREGALYARGWHPSQVVVTASFRDTRDEFNPRTMRGVAEYRSRHTRLVEVENDPDKNFSVVVDFENSDGYVEIFSFLEKFYRKPLRRHFVSTVRDNISRLFVSPKQKLPNGVTQKGTPKFKTLVGKSLKTRVQNYLDSSQNRPDTLSDLQKLVAEVLTDRTRSDFLRDKIASLRETYLADYKDFVFYSAKLRGGDSHE